MKILRLLTIVSILAMLALPTMAGDSKKDGATQLPGAEVKPGIKWLSYDEGLVKAKKEGKHLFIDFSTKWCGYCKKMDASTFVEPGIVDLLNNDFIPVKIDGDSEKELNVDGYKVTEKNLSRQEYKVRGYPTFWFLEADGTKLGAVQGYQSASNLLATLQYVKDKKYAEEVESRAKKPEQEKQDKN